MERSTAESCASDLLRALPAIQVLLMCCQCVGKTASSCCQGGEKSEKSVCWYATV